MTTNKHTILIVDDNERQQNLFKTFLEQYKYNILVAANGIEALEVLAEKSAKISLIISDIRMPQMSGIELLKNISDNENFSQIPILLVTAFADVKDAVNAIRFGACDYLEKPVDLPELLKTIKKYINTSNEVNDNEFENQMPKIPDWAIFKSKVMLEVLKDIAIVANSDAGVLVTGESGTGKEVMTDIIVEWSYRKDKPLIKMNCAAIPENLLESELFGHEKGAFTGANNMRKGIFEEANGGTVFLDEIGEMSPMLQAKLLRVTQDGTFCRLGSSKVHTTDVRIVAATNRNLEEEIEKGNFREDLYYRLNVMEIALPPLRERIADIMPLAEFFARKFNQNSRVRFSNEAINCLESYTWSGNIRELRNVIERAVLLARGDNISIEFLPKKLTLNFNNNSIISENTESKNTQKTMAEIERQAILNCLRQNDYNRSHTAKELGIGRRTLIYKLRVYEEEGYQVNKEK
ncbi:sigma-54 dependent transcriptional regulator [Lentisphaerota bacterium WC36G]|nr:sigma-54 dependent transcriptional regulator [Lentisphaerae bacterium WC36]